ncbi:MAG: hypothetical protein JWQ04_76 [Pedosphaera sp.]|nr:hypothetical protein [Pedosphaera sp.]
MKPNFLLVFVLSAVVLVTGCATYDYQITEPASLARHVADVPVAVAYDPLEYRFVRHKDRLGVTIMNPTDDRITLLGDRSYLVDPRGESHPIRGRVVAPHSYARMLLPPVPVSGETTVFPTYPYYSPGWYGPGWYGPGSPYFWGDYYYGPVTSYYRIRTPYDWKWDVGPARFRFTYDRAGRLFDHDFVIVRERVK